MSDKKRLDTTKIAFPIDRVTWGQCRILDPARFDDRDLDNLHESDVAVAHFYELLLAESAFGEAIGHRADHQIDDRDQVVDLLNDVYTKYGISSGPATTNTLVQEFIAAAKAQACASPQQGPSR